MRSSILILMIALGVCAQGGAQPKDKSVEELTELLKPSTVVITSKGRDAKTDGLGTGFIISSDGLIATNAHVVGEGRLLAVEMVDGKKFDVVAIHAIDRQKDLAIIKIDQKSLKPIKLAEPKSLKDGQSVVALGNPKGLKYSVVSGVVSSIREVEGRRMIQIAMPVEPGNSGGPLVDLQGRVHGIITLKSLVTDNLGFAAIIDDLIALQKKPSPIAMSAWATIGALDPDDWKPEMGAQWTQRAGKILVEGPGTGFGGRSICIAQQQPPALPYEVTITVKLNDERGAAGLLFRHDGKKHYGFYPTGGKVRLTRFDGADVYSWKILQDVEAPSYRPGEWNTLKIRVEKAGAKCYVNDQLVIETDDADWADGKVGLCKFRETKAEFKQFKVAKTLATAQGHNKEVNQLIDDLLAKKFTNKSTALPKLTAAPGSTEALRQKALALEAQAQELKNLALQLHEEKTIAQLIELFKKPEIEVDLIHAALLLSKLDREDLDIDAYRAQVDKMAAKVKAQLPKEATDDAKIKLLNQYLFEQRGFHGSRTEYYNKSNSYLNEVLDDREGLPISLAVVYLELARRIQLPMAGIGLPGHFVVQHRPAKGPGTFIDVFEQGKTLSQAEAEKKAEEFYGDKVPESFFKPVGYKAIIARMLQNLLRVAQRDQDVESGLRYLNATLAIDPKAAASRGMRVGLYLSKGMKTEAIADIDYLIENPSEDVDISKLRQLRQQLER